MSKTPNKAARLTIQGRKVNHTNAQNNFGAIAPPRFSRPLSSMFRKHIFNCCLIALAFTANNVFASIPDWKKCEFSARTIDTLAGVLEKYKADKGFYPGTNVGIEALLKEGYIERIPQSAWGHEIIYTSGSLEEFSLGVLGEGNQKGGERFNADYFWGDDVESYIEGCKGFLWWFWDNLSH